MDCPVKKLKQCNIKRHSSEDCCSVFFFSALDDLRLRWLCLATTSSQERLIHNGVFDKNTTQQKKTKTKTSPLCVSPQKSCFRGNSSVLPTCQTWQHPSLQRPKLRDRNTTDKVNSLSARKLEKKGRKKKNALYPSQRCKENLYFGIIFSLFHIPRCVRQGLCSPFLFLSPF